MWVNVLAGWSWSAEKEYKLDNIASGWDLVVKTWASSVKAVWNSLPYDTVKPVSVEWWVEYNRLQWTMDPNHIQTRKISETEILIVFEDDYHLANNNIRAVIWTLDADNKMSYWEVYDIYNEDIDRLEMCELMADKSKFAIFFTPTAWADANKVMTLELNITWWVITTSNLIQIDTGEHLFFDACYLSDNKVVYVHEISDLQKIWVIDYTWWAWGVYWSTHQFATWASSAYVNVWPTWNPNQFLVWYSWTDADGYVIAWTLSWTTWTFWAALECYTANAANGEHWWIFENVVWKNIFMHRDQNEDVRIHHIETNVSNVVTELSETTLSGDWHYADMVKIEDDKFVAVWRESDRYLRLRTFTTDPSTWVFETNTTWTRRIIHTDDLYHDYTMIQKMWDKYVVTAHNRSYYFLENIVYDIDANLYIRPLLTKGWVEHVWNSAANYSANTIKLSETKFFHICEEDYLYDALIARIWTVDLTGKTTYSEPVDTLLSNWQALYVDSIEIETNKILTIYNDADWVCSYIVYDVSWATPVMLEHNTMFQNTVDYMRLTHISNWYVLMSFMNDSFSDRWEVALIKLDWNTPIIKSTLVINPTHTDFLKAVKVRDNIVAVTYRDNWTSDWGEIVMIKQTWNNLHIMWHVDFSETSFYPNDIETVWDDRLLIHGSSWYIFLIKYVIDWDLATLTPIQLWKYYYNRLRVYPEIWSYAAMAKINDTRYVAVWFSWQVNTWSLYVYWDKILWTRKINLDNRWQRDGYDYSVSTNLECKPIVMQNGKFVLFPYLRLNPSYSHVQCVWVIEIWEDIKHEHVIWFAKSWGNKWDKIKIQELWDTVQWTNTNNTWTYFFDDQGRITTTETMRRFWQASTYWRIETWLNTFNW